MNDKEKKAVEFVKKRTEELKKYAKRENETTYDDIVLNLVDRLLKENEELNNRCRNLDKEAQGYLEELAGDDTLSTRTIKQLQKENEELKNSLIEAEKELVQNAIEDTNDDISDENNIKYVDLVFENCEVARLYPNMFKYLVIENIVKNKNINCFQYEKGECWDNLSCSYFAITILPEGYNQKMDWINQSLKERLESCNDITSIYLTYNTGEEEGFLVPWKEGNEYINEYQTIHEDKFEDNAIQIEIKNKSED